MPGGGSGKSIVEVLADAQSLGILGEAPIAEVISHSRQFLGVLDGVSGRVVDLGTGAGVPGLVLAEARPDLEFTLVDRRQSRTDVLAKAVAALGWSSRVEVRCAEARQLAQEPTYHRRCSAVVSRGFGPPPTLLPIAREFLRLGGVLGVSEPPRPDPDRWPESLLGSLGFGNPLYGKGIAVFHVEH